MLEREPALSPLQGFPQELLGEVLTACLPPILDHHARRQFLILRSVCREWRQAAFGTHVLWAGIIFRMHEKAEWTKEGRIPWQAIRSWFDRAGATPLHFELVFDVGRDNPRGMPVPEGLEEDLPKLYGLLREEGREWRGVCVGYVPSFGAPLESFRGMLEGNLALSAGEGRGGGGGKSAWRDLRTLGVPVTSDLVRSPGFVSWIGNLGRYSPRLEDLELFVTGPSKRSKTIKARVEHPDVTRLTLTFQSISVLNVMDVAVCGLSNLKRLELLCRDRFSDTRKYPEQYELHPRFFMHERIEELVVVSSSDPYYPLEFLTLPSLRSLTCRWKEIPGKGGVISPDRSILAFLLRSGAELREVDLGEMGPLVDAGPEVWCALAECTRLRRVVLSSWTLERQLEARFREAFLKYWSRVGSAVCEGGSGRSGPGRVEGEEGLPFAAIREIVVYGHLDKVDLKAIARYFLRRQSLIEQSSTSKQVKERLDYERQSSSGDGGQEGLPRVQSRKEEIVIKFRGRDGYALEKTEEMRRDLESNLEYAKAFGVLDGLGVRVVFEEA
ncbi:hypothetical protein CC1G_02373 [Coprinopsis cinerea okayama7|uniref:F-box domain-containing protein n=1 Tax=Coprinopsis cinerea (strain Okayama-7 / 130 / ATCC MYA-4618 / FGSC 9003) TaxID=240176 RepID=A8N7W6_COPC7|nr:hypothetical protein CC1G_02373 [Coprinopsis cinerea okayama7\|eukprot:XP_001830922.1 hypothetical protein CC1G_02373 [Coprinopsis cinerea okayama7\